MSNAGWILSNNCVGAERRSLKYNCAPENWLKMKMRFAILLIILLLTLTGCGGKAESPQPQGVSIARRGESLVKLTLSGNDSAVTETSAVIDPQPTATASVTATFAPFTLYPTRRSLE